MYQTTGGREAHGRRAVVRNGYLPRRSVLAGIGPVPVRQPRVRERRPPADGQRFCSRILPRYLRKARSVEALIPWLYLKGVSTGQFGEALQALVGLAAEGLSAGTVNGAFPTCTARSGGPSQCHAPWAWLATSHARPARPGWLFGDG